MTRARWLGVMAGVAVLATLGLLIAPRLLGQNGLLPIPERHVDGVGPLGSGEEDPHGAVSYTFSRSAPGGVWTLGIRLCLAAGDQPAILDGSVQPHSSIGRGFSFLGARIRQFIPAQGDHPIGSVVGFPPKVSEALNQLQGFAVTDRCQGPNPDDSKPYTELLLGFGRGTDTDGGGWKGVDVGYTSGGQHHIVELRYDILMCGTTVKSDYCATH